MSKHSWGRPGNTHTETRLWWVACLFISAWISNSNGLFHLSQASSDLERTSFSSRQSLAGMRYEPGLHTTQQSMKLWARVETFSVFYLEPKVIFKKKTRQSEPSVLSSQTGWLADWLTHSPRTWENKAERARRHPQRQLPAPLWLTQSHLNSKVKRSLYFPLKYRSVPESGL